MAINSLATSSGSGLATQEDLLTAGGLVRITSEAFSTVSSVSINNCFSSTYYQYLLIYSGTASIDNSSMLYRMRASGSDASGATDYERAVSFQDSAGNLQNSSNTSSGTSSGFFAANNTDGCSAYFYVYRPFETVETFTQGNSVTRFSGVTQNHRFGNHHAQSVAYDGITVFVASGTISGDIAVFGIKG